jgi:predicted lipoprotein with Yx(FWY)xxD motif
MEEFWEKSFRNNKVMWGWEPTVSANRALELFKKKGFKTILIPGFGYGRNAKLFADNGFEVTGEETKRDSLAMPYGVTLYFYDKDTIMRDFEAYGLIDASLMDEPKANEDDKPSRGFWYIVCKKDE